MVVLWRVAVTGPEPKQVAVALEPATAPCNTLATAEASRLAIVLAPGNSFSWNLHIERTRPGASYDDFCAFVQQGRMAFFITQNQLVAFAAASAPVPCPSFR